MPFRPTLDFLLYDWLRVQDLTGRERHADHNRHTFDAVLDACERLARDKYAPFNRLVDTEEPKAVMGEDGALRVILPQATHDAHQAYAESGMLSAAQDVAMGGMQLPYVVESAANSFFAKASVSMGTGLLTVGNANLLLAHGSPRQGRHWPTSPPAPCPMGPTLKATRWAHGTESVGTRCGSRPVNTS